MSHINMKKNIWGCKLTTCFAGPRASVKHLNMEVNYLWGNRKTLIKTTTKTKATFLKRK